MGKPFDALTFQAILSQQILEFHCDKLIPIKFVTQYNLAFVVFLGRRLSTQRCRLPFAPECMDIDH